MMHVLDRLEQLLGTRGATGVRRPLHAEAVRTSLAATIEFAAVRWSWWRTRGEDLLDILPGDAETPAALGNYGRLLPDLRRSTNLVVIHQVAGQGEVHEVPSAMEDWRSGTPFSLFQERFKMTLTRHNVPPKFAAALCGALAEMASNAREHSQSPVPPIASYELTQDRWSFSVTDVGCGVLESLRRNPIYASLQDEVGALRLALKKGVSSTGDRHRGEGFPQLFHALVNRMCTLRLRSRGAAINWEGVSPADHLLQLMPLPARAGFHVCVSAPLGS